MEGARYTEGARDTEGARESIPEEDEAVRCQVAAGENESSLLSGAGAAGRELNILVEAVNLERVRLQVGEGPGLHLVRRDDLVLRRVARVQLAPELSELESGLLGGAEERVVLLRIVGRRDGARRPVVRLGYLKVVIKEEVIMSELEKLPPINTQFERGLAPIFRDASPLVQG